MDNLFGGGKWVQEREIGSLGKPEMESFHRHNQQPACHEGNGSDEGGKSEWRRQAECLVEREGNQVFAGFSFLVGRRALTMANHKGENPTKTAKRTEDFRQADQAKRAEQDQTAKQAPAD